MTRFNKHVCLFIHMWFPRWPVVTSLPCFPIQSREWNHLLIWTHRRLPDGSQHPKRQHLCGEKRFQNFHRTDRSCHRRQFTCVCCASATFKLIGEVLTENTHHWQLDAKVGTQCGSRGNSKWDFRWSQHGDQNSLLSSPRKLTNHS